MTAKHFDLGLESKSCHSKKMCLDKNHTPNRRGFGSLPHCLGVELFPEEGGNGAHHRQKTYTASWTQHGDTDAWGRAGALIYTFTHVDAGAWHRGTWSDPVVHCHPSSFCHQLSEPRIHRQAKANTGTCSLSPASPNTHTYTQSPLPKFELYSWAQHSHPWSNPGTRMKRQTVGSFPVW